MNDKTLVEQLRDLFEAFKGQRGRTYSSQLFKEAAGTIEAQATRIEALEAALREAMSRCTDCGGRGSFVKRDEVTDRDLWESCASCAVGYAALEGTKL